MYIEYLLYGEEHELCDVLDVPLGRGGEGVDRRVLVVGHGLGAQRGPQLPRQQQAHARVELQAAPHQLALQQRRLRALLRPTPQHITMNLRPLPYFIRRFLYRPLTELAIRAF